MVDSNGTVDQFLHWLGTEGLYNALSLSGDDAERLAEAVSSGLRLDCYCVQCEKVSTFSHRPAQRLAPRIPRSITSNTEYESSFSRAINYLRTAVAACQFSCARQTSHSLIIFVRVSGEEAKDTINLMKIGQWPSQFDLISSDLQRYQRSLGAADLRELKAAAICHSAGFHVAAFAYLRRLFERRIEVAHQGAKTTPGWNDAAYDNAFFMEDKIDQLRDHLPAFLVEHRKIYNILSKGIHELSESDCAEGYSVVLLGITLILDEEIEQHRREESIKAAGKNLQQLHERYKKQPPAVT